MASPMLALHWQHECRDSLFTRLQSDFCACRGDFRTNLLFCKSAHVGISRPLANFVGKLSSNACVSVSMEKFTNNQFGIAQHTRFCQMGHTDGEALCHKRPLPFIAQPGIATYKSNQVLLHRAHLSSICSPPW